MAKVSNAPANTASVSSAPSGGGMSIAAGADYNAPDKSDGAYSTEDVMALLAGDGEGQGGEENLEADSAPSVEGGEEGAQEAAGGEESHEADYPMPEGWEDAMWKALQPEARGKVDALIKGHADAVSRHTGEMEAMKAQTAQTLAKANAEAQQLLDFARQVVEGEFANVNWQELRQNPELYMQAQDLFNGRRSALNQLQAQLAANQQAAQQQAMAQAQAALASEFAATEPKLKAMMGAEYERVKFRDGMRDYLKKAGATDAEISGINRGYMLELATKAMLYDKSFEARQAAAAKVAEAPKVQAPNGSGSDNGDGARLKAARAHLNKNPNSTEALAALFAAM